MRIVNLFIILIFASSSWAHTPKEGKVMATAGPYVYSTLSGRLQPPFKPGFGLVAEGDVDDNGGLEIGMFFVTKHYVREDGGKYIQESGKRVFVTLGYRHWFTRRISAAAALSSGYSMGDAKILYSDFPQNQEIDTTARERTEYGAELSVQYELATMNEFAIVLDSRYNRALTQKDHEQADHYGAILGIKYLVQEK